MVLSKQELIAALQNEVRILLHLASKVDPEKLDYRPTPSQRSLLELLQYLVIMGPIHLRGALASSWDRDTWGSQWTAEEAAAKKMNPEEIREAIGKHPALFAELLSPCSDADLRTPIEMFGMKAARGSMIVSLVLCHYAAYRMQLFLYLKASGREELNTLNLWVGRDTL
jgi:hypothetical protein